MHLPVELVEAILDNLLPPTGTRKPASPSSPSHATHKPSTPTPTSPPDLHATSLVCKTWCTLSQTRLFHTLSLSKPSSFPRLLALLTHSPRHPSLCAAIRRLEIDVPAHMANWTSDPALTELVRLILLRPTALRSLALRGPRSKQRLFWGAFPDDLREAILDVVRRRSVEEVEVDGWVFEMPVREFVGTFLASPFLRRVTLKHAFSGMYSEEEVDEAVEVWEPPVRLNLDVLDVHVDDYLDVNPRVREDLARVLCLDLSTRLDLRLLLNTAFWAFGNCGEYFMSEVASVVEKLELSIGFRNNFIFSLSNHTNLKHLVIDGTNSPAAIQFVQSTLSTLSPTTPLHKLTLKFCFYTLPKRQWVEFTDFLASTLSAINNSGMSGIEELYPDNRALCLDVERPGVRVDFDITMKQGREEDLGLGILRNAGLGIGVQVNDGSRGSERPFPFYLYSRF